MKIETKYSVGDTVFFEQYGTIKKGKIVDVDISSNRFKSMTTYEVNTAPAWYEMFSFRWNKWSQNFTEDELYSSIDEIAEKYICYLQLEIDIRNEKIRKIREQVSKEINHES